MSDGFVDRVLEGVWGNLLEKTNISTKRSEGEILAKRFPYIEIQVLKTSEGDE